MAASRLGAYSGSVGFRTLVVVPTYDERESLPRLVAGVHAVLPQAHVLVVDDASPDGTGRHAERMARRDPRIAVLCRSGKLGLGTAYVEGFRHALAEGYDRVVQMDADGSHDPAALPELVGRLRDADLVIGSRKLPGGGTEGWGAHRTVISRSGALYCELFLGMRLTDPTSGYRALGRRALEVLLSGPIRSEGFAFQVEVAYRLHRLGLRLVEHPIRFVDRAEGPSKMSAAIFVEAALAVPLLRAAAAVGAL